MVAGSARTTLRVPAGMYSGPEVRFEEVSPDRYWETPICPGIRNEVVPEWSATLTLRLFQGCPSERSRWRGGRCRVYEVGRCDSYAQINCGSQGGPCDPSTQNHAGGTPASSLLRGYHTTLRPLRRKIRPTLPLFSGSPGHAAHP